MASWRPQGSVGSLAALTRNKFLECLFLYDDDGYQSCLLHLLRQGDAAHLRNPDCTR